MLFVFGLGFLLYREMRIANPIVNFRVLGERNFAMSCVIIFCAFAVLYAASIALPALLQELFGYDALAAGLVLSPSGISSISMMVIVGFLMGRGADARWLIAAGLIVVAASNYWMAYMNIEISPWQAAAPRMVLAAGLGLIFAPINVAAFKYTPQRLRGAAVGLFALLRNEGGSVGTSMSQTIQERREQFHLSRLDDSLDLFNPNVVSFLDSARPCTFSKTAIRRSRTSWRCKSWPTFASSRRRPWPISTSSGSRPSWRCCSCRRPSDEALGGGKGRTGRRRMSVPGVDAQLRFLASPRRWGCASV